MFNQILNGSLLSDQRLMQAREQYSPSGAALSPALAFARWTERVSVQSDLGSAREIAGLTDEELSAMEAEFVRCPNRPRSAWVRKAMPAGGALAILGGLGLAVQGLVSGLTPVAHAAAQWAGAGCLMSGLMILALGFLSAFSTVHLELCHGTTGLYFGRLDEQHPWLFKTMNLTYNPAAEKYRQSVLRDRGWLRGVDHVIMRELVRVREALDQTQPTRSVAERIQLLPAPIEAPSPPQPHLVRMSGTSRSQAAG